MALTFQGFLLEGAWIIKHVLEGLAYAGNIQRLRQPVPRIWWTGEVTMHPWKPFSIFGWLPNCERCFHPAIFAVAVGDYWSCSLTLLTQCQKCFQPKTSRWTLTGSVTGDPFSLPSIMTGIQLLMFRIYWKVYPFTQFLVIKKEQ